MESDLALRVALPTRANSVGKNFDIRVEIRNCSSSVHPGGVLTVQEQVPHGGPTSYLRTSTKRVAAILPFSTVSLVVEVSILASASLETLAQGLLVDFAGVSQACALFPGDFLSPFLSTSSSTETYNLLLFGWSGATKSSFINSCATLFEKRLVMPAVEGGTSAHCTVKLQPYALPNTSIVLWDTWGVTLENYHGAVLRALLDGAIPAGTDMSSLPQVKMPTASDNTMHNVLFFFPAAAVADPAMDSVREILRDHYFACRRKGRRPVILLSKIDEQSIDVRQCPASMCAKTEELKQKLLELLKEDVEVTPSRILPLVNYRSETQPNFELDRGIYSILLTAVRAAQWYILQA